MKLEQYPGAIAGIERRILKLETRIRRIQETISTLSAEADREIAFSADLKNEGQRKARKDELLANNPQYTKALQQIDGLTDRRIDLHIDLVCYRNQFSVCKLRLRDAISRREATATSNHDQNLRS